MQSFPVLFLLALLGMGYCLPKVSKEQQQQDDTSSKQREPWFTHAVTYHIYPRSFQDSNGDGTGDLKGIESRLDHFASLGVDAIWLSPIFKSPMKDFGYDVSDYKNIDPIFGTLADFGDLSAAAHMREIKIVLDFVPNHSSDEHEWFQQSVQRIEPYTDYYVWADPSGFDEEENPLPPNNWVSVFRFSAWEWSPERGQFYLHQFVKEQPELNYRNPLVKQEMLEVLKFWLDMGVDGFRVDASAHLVEDAELRDEPLSGNNPDADDYDHLDHIYTYNLQETRDILTEMYRLIQQYNAQDGYARVVILELYLPDEDQALYYDCGDFPFNFNLIQNDATAESVEEAIRRWMTHVPEGKSANWVLGNHDSWRLGSRLGESMINPMNMIALSLPGVAFNYQGDEIGMLNNMDITWEEAVDPAGCNCGMDNFFDRGCSRDPERTPMQWTSAANAGFSTPGAVPWLPINQNYVTLNVAAQETDPDSHLSVYRSMIELRNTDRDSTFKLGHVLTHREGDVLAVGRAQGNLFLDVYATVVNFGNSVGQISIFGQFHPDLETGIVEISSMTSGNNPVGELLPLYRIVLQPKEAIVVRFIKL